MFSHDVEGWHTEKEPKQPKVTPPRETDAERTPDAQRTPDAEREQSQTRSDDKGEQK